MLLTLDSIFSQVPTETRYRLCFLDTGSQKFFKAMAFELLFSSNIKNGIDGHILINYRKSNDNNSVKNLFYGFIDN